MKKIQVLIVTLFLSVGSYAMKQGTPTISKIDSLLDVSFQATLAVDIERSLEFALEALSESEQINYSAGKSKACFYIGQALFNLGTYKEALEYLAMAEQEKHAADNPLLLAEIDRVRGRLYGSMGLTDAAIKEFKRGLKHINSIEVKANRDYLTSLAYDNLTNIYQIADISDSVFFYMQKNKALLESMDEAFIFRTWINLYGNLGAYYSNNKQYDLATFNFQQSLDLAKKYEYPYTSTVHRYMGDMELEKNNPDASLSYYFKALKNHEETNLKNELPALYEKISLVYSEKGIADSAQHYHNKALLIENELSKEKLSASEIALNLIMKKEFEHKSKKGWFIVSIISGCFLLLLVAGSGYYLLRLRKSRKLIKEKERETIQLKEKLNESFDEVLSLAKKNDPFFLTRFQEVYPEFTQNLLQKHPNIANSELSFCAMIFLNFTSKEIAQYTFIEHRSVQTKKSRLRKKLNVPSGVDLYHYLKSHA